MSVIDDLAATVREQLDEVEWNTERGYLHAPEIPGYTGLGRHLMAALPPAVAALVLREVAAKRAQVDLLLAEKHGLVRWDHDLVRACESVIDKPCDCGRDERVTAYLALLAAPYTTET